MKPKIEFSLNITFPSTAPIGSPGLAEFPRLTRLDYISRGIDLFKKINGWVLAYRASVCTLMKGYLMRKPLDRVRRKYKG